MFRPRSAAWAGFALGMSLLAPSVVHAAAEVHRFNVALSAAPTGVDAAAVNDVIDFYNRTVITPPPRGYDPVAQISFGWLFTGEVRYFLTRNLAMNAGVSQLRSKTAKEYLPALSQSIDVRAELITAPVHIGAAYYLQPYNQGDFQARAYLGGGFLSLVQSRLKYQQTANGVPGQTSYVTAWKRDAPGFYVEGGVHMFFASRFSVLLGAIYRSAKIEALLDRSTNEPGYAPDGQPLSMDLSGVGGRMGLAIGF